MEDKVINLPDFTKTTFNRNFIKTAVCEIRFPILLELENTPPKAFQKTFRRKYPNFAVRTSINLQVGDQKKENFYVFSSLDKVWTISIKSSSISIETNKYTSFTEFLDRFTELLPEANKFIDSPIYTRVGLRFIDVIPKNLTDIDGWIKKELLNPFSQIGEPTMFWSAVKGKSEHGNFTFQYGVQETNQSEVILDFDFFVENIEVKQVTETLKKLHQDSLKLFHWSIEEKSFSYLKE